MKRIAVDIDGVLADSLVKFLEWLKTNRDFNLCAQDVINVCEEKGPENVGFGQEIVMNYVEFINDQGDSIKPFPGALSVLDNLSKQYELWAVTSRGQFIKDTTNRWLSQYFGNHFNDENTVYVMPEFIGKKTKVPEMLKNDIGLLIDDSDIYIREVADAGLYGIIFNSPICIKHPNVRNVRDWSETYVEIMNLNY